MSVDPRDRFTGLSDCYRRHRPDYPAVLVDWIVSTSGIGPGASVLDLGCGTGIASRLFAARGFRVTGVDPNEEMLAAARGEGGAEFVRGESSATGLPDASYDLAVAAQAFHWFPVPETLRELRRVLRPGSWCAAFWHLRGSSPLMDEYHRLLVELVPEYSTLKRPGSAVAEIRSTPGPTDFREAEFAHAQRFDREGFFGRVHSSSYVKHGLADPAAFDRALGELF